MCGDGCVKSLLMMIVKNRSIVERWHGLHPQILLVLGAFSALLSYYNLEILYHASIVAFILTLLSSKIRLYAITKIILYAFAVNVVFVCISSIVFYEDVYPALNAIRRYWLPVIYASLLFGRKTTLADTLYSHVWYKTLIVLTTFAYVQYFISTDLWGVIPSDRTTLTEWSEGMEFFEYAIFFRAFSLMGSPQVWGLYSALSILVLSDIKGLRISKIIIWFLWVGSFLSGNKIAFILFCIYAVKVLAKNHSRIFRLGFIALLFFGLFSMSQKAAFENIRVIEHIFNISEIAEQENVGRLARWENVTGKINPVLGGGATFFNQPSNLEYPAESYLLQSFTEISIIYPVFFVLILAFNYIFRKHNRALVIGLFIATISGAAFDHPAFISFWLLLIGIGLNEKSRQDLTTTSVRSIS